MADISLFHSIAQTSATFVAIIAGFYTTKIVTLSNDKRRILQRINELDNELQVKQVYLEGLKKTESDTVNYWDKERIDVLIDLVRGDFYVYEQVHSFEELRNWLNEHYGPLTKNQESLLKDLAPEVLEEFENKRNQRKEPYIIE